MLKGAWFLSLFQSEWCGEIYAKLLWHVLTLSFVMFFCKWQIFIPGHFDGFENLIHLLPNVMQQENIDNVGLTLSPLVVTLSLKPALRCPGICVVPRETLLPGFVSGWIDARIDPQTHGVPPLCWLSRYRSLGQGSKYKWNQLPIVFSWLFDPLFGSPPGLRNRIKIAFLFLLCDQVFKAGFRALTLAWRLF